MWHVVDVSLVDVAAVTGGSSCVSVHTVLFAKMLGVNLNIHCDERF